MNDTPETDALQIRLRDSDFRDSYIVMLGHAQKLERERNALRKTAEGNGIMAHSAQCQVVELRKALEIAKEYVEEALANKKDMFAGYPGKWQMEEHYLNQINKALETSKQNP